MKIHHVPHDTDSLGYDRYREGIYPLEHSMIAKPHTMSARLKEEYRALTTHCSRSLYRVEFQRCKSRSCALCAKHVERKCPLNDFFNRFPHNRLPSPIPKFPVFPAEMFKQRWYRDAKFSAGWVESNPKLEGLMAPKNPASGSDQGAGIDRIAGHYRTFGDLLQSHFPKNSSIYSTDYYRGPTRQIPCSACRLPHVLQTDAAYRRHYKTIHVGCSESEMVQDESD